MVSLSLNSMYDFPNTSDIKSEFVNSIPKEKIDELISHLQLRYEKILNPTTTRQRIELLHVESLIKIARSRKLAIDILEEVGARR